MSGNEIAALPQELLSGANRFGLRIEALSRIHTTSTRLKELGSNILLQWNNKER